MNEHHSLARWQRPSGFLLAAIGAAIGLRGLWQVPFLAGSGGGLAFALAYLLMVLLVGVPLLLAEFALGRGTRHASFTALHSAAPPGPWRWLGVLGLLVASLALAHLSVMAGWLFKALVLVFTGRFPGPAGARLLHGFVSERLQPLVWQVFPLAVAVAVVARGVRRGIERTLGGLVILFALLLLILLAYAAVLPGFARGAAFAYAPRWSQLGQPGLWIGAASLALVTTGVARGVMITFGSYVEPQTSLPRAAFVVAGGQALAALLAGLVVPALLASAGAPQAQGPDLAFRVLPQALAALPAARVIAAMVYLLVLVAALSTMVALLQVPVAWSTHYLGLPRAPASVAAALLVLLLGLPLSVGLGPLAGVKVPGQGLPRFLDVFAQDALIGLNGVLLAIFFGWVWPARDAAQAAGLRPGGRAAALWRFLLRWLLPLLLGLVFLRSVWPNR